jgi:hypothetical protein
MHSHPFQQTAFGRGAQTLGEPRGGHIARFTTETTLFVKRGGYARAFEATRVVRLLA